MHNTGNVPIISVITPVYNSCRYLETCLDSLLNQTYDNVEIILVDNGSNDGSSKICDEYKKKSDSIKVIHTERIGAGSARNIGLQSASGEYIGFVDSDDYIEKDMYEFLFGLMKDDVDITICGIVDESIGRDDYYAKKTDYHVEICEKREIIKRILIGMGVGYSSCNKLFRRDLIEEIRFADGSSGEDMMFVYLSVKRSRKTIISNYGAYHYVHHRFSTTGGAFGMERLASLRFQLKISEDVIMVFSDLKLEAQYAVIRTLSYLWYQLINCGDGKFIDVQSAIKELYNAYSLNLDAIKNNTYIKEYEIRSLQEIDEAYYRIISGKEYLEGGKKLLAENSIDRVYLDMMNQWMILNYEGKTISKLFEKQGVSRIIVYGMNIYGRHLIRDLSKTGIIVICALDIDPKGPYMGIEVVRPEDYQITGKCDLVINAVLSQRDVVKKTIEKLFDVRVQDLDDLVFDAYLIN